MERDPDEATSDLPAAEARYERLLGERRQLLAQIDRLQRQLAEAQQRLGALQAAAGRPAPGGLRGLLDRTRRALRRAEGPTAEPAPPPAETPPLVPWRDGRPMAVVTVDVRGLREAALTRVLDLVTAGTAERPAVAVFITDSLDFAPFRARRQLFEFVPPPEERRRKHPGRSWRLYAERRLKLIEWKWQPQAALSFRPPQPPEGGTNPD